MQMFVHCVVNGSEGGHGGEDHHFGEALPGSTAGGYLRPWPERQAGEWSSQQGVPFQTSKCFLYTVYRQRANERNTNKCLVIRCWATMSFQNSLNTTWHSLYKSQEPQWRHENNTSDPHCKWYEAGWKSKKFPFQYFNSTILFTLHLFPKILQIAFYMPHSGVSIILTRTVNHVLIIAFECQNSRPAGIACSSAFSFLTPAIEFLLDPHTDQRSTPSMESLKDTCWLFICTD